MKINFDLLERAIALATEKHDGQVDKGGKPYIEHCLRVMDMLSSLDEKIVGVLHDAVEDTDLTLDELIDSGFPHRIVLAIDAISRKPDESRGSYMRRVTGNELALKVKIADLTDNTNLERIENPSRKDLRRVEIYLRDLKRLKRLEKNENQ